MENLQEQKLAINNLEKEMKKEMANIMEEFLTKNCRKLLENHYKITSASLTPRLIKLMMT